MASLVAPCPSCGLRTLTTHAACIHCGAPLPEEAPLEAAAVPAEPLQAPEEAAAPEPPPKVSSAAPDAPIDTERVTRRPLPKREVNRGPADTVWPPRMRQQFNRRPAVAPKPPGISEAGRLQAHLRGRCPNGHGALTPASLGDRPAQLCLHCNGLWLDLPSFDAFVLPLVPPVFEGAPPTGPDSASVARPLPCPVCTAPLAPLVRAGLEGHALAHCPKHGVWIEDEQMKDLLRRIARTPPGQEALP